MNALKPSHKVIVHEMKDECAQEKHHFGSRQELLERIEKKAYELYEARGCAPGRNLDDWLEAERIVEAQTDRALDT